MTHSSRWLLLVVLMVGGCIHMSCPTCARIAKEMRRVDAGIVLTNYNTVTDLTNALVLDGVPMLGRDVDIIVTQYAQQGVTSLCAVCLYVPESYATTLTSISTPLSNSLDKGVALISGMFAGNLLDVPLAMYDASHERVIVVGPRWQVDYMTKQYVATLPPWLRDVECSKHRRHRTMPSSRTADPRHASCGAGAAPRVAAAHG
jgi:hypothetical protein